MNDNSIKVTRKPLATDAFYGANDSLYAVIAERMSYTHDGIAHDSNGCTLAEAVAVVDAMTAEEIEELEALGLLC